MYTLYIGNKNYSSWSLRPWVLLQSLGIPAEVISVPPNKILRPDLQIDNVNATTRWRTFWYLAEDEDL